MVVVLNYSKKQDENLNKVLKELAIPFEYSLNEAHITKADQIILPDAANLSSAYRKLNVMNLFSFLRLINKPILGINAGFQLMCHEFSKEKCGLGFFDLKLISGMDKNLSEVSGILAVSHDSRLISQSMKNHQINITIKNYIDYCDLSKAWAIVDSKKISVSLEDNNYYGLLLAEENNDNIFSDAINNFSKFV